MKQLYTLVFFFMVAVGFSQESRQGGDIDGFKLYPNPTISGKIYITTADNAPKTVHIFDVLGTQVLKATILGKELNVSHLDKGVYILRVVERDKVATRKLIIK